MKKLMMLFSILLLIGGVFSCKSKNNVNTDNLNLFTVYKIDSVQSYYLIYFQKDDKKFKVVSKKDNDDNCNKIILNKKYSLSIASILEEKIVMNNDTIVSGNNGLVNCFYFEGGTKICKEENNGIYDLFKSSNIKGLCYLPEGTDWYKSNF